MSDGFSHQARLVRQRWLAEIECQICRKYADEATRIINDTRTDPVLNKLGLPYPDEEK